MQEQEKAVGEHNPFTKMGMSQVLGDFNHCLSDFSGLAYCQLYRLWLTFDQTAYYRLASGFSANPACDDRGFDCSDLGNRSLFGTTLAGWFGG